MSNFEKLVFELENFWKFWIPKIITNKLKSLLSPHISSTCTTFSSIPHFQSCTSDVLLSTRMFIMIRMYHVIHICMQTCYINRRKKRDFVPFYISSSFIINITSLLACFSAQICCADWVDSGWLNRRRYLWIKWEDFFCCLRLWIEAS